MANKQKIWIRGSAREKVFDNGGEVINVSININDLTAYVNDKGYVPIVLAQRNEVDDYGNTHYMYVDEYSLQRQKERQETASTSEVGEKVGETRENPFR